jgi:hypothetical protein
MPELTRRKAVQDHGARIEQNCSLRQRSNVGRTTRARNAFNYEVKDFTCTTRTRFHTRVMVYDSVKGWQCLVLSFC